MNLRRIVAWANWFAGHKPARSVSRWSGVADVLVATVIAILAAVYLVHELANCARASAWC